jgi:hypothetical protein
VAFNDDYLNAVVTISSATCKSYRAYAARSRQYSVANVLNRVTAKNSQVAST